MRRKRGQAATRAWGMALAAAVALAALPAKAQDTGAPLLPEVAPPTVQGQPAAAPPSLWAAELGVGAGAALWEGLRILPEGWVASSTAVSAPFRLKRLGVDPTDVQGRQWWLNREVPEAGVSPRPWPDVPEDAFAARGHWGQSITVVPSLDVVIVRVADDREAGAFDFNRFLSLALALVR